jgi:regulator of cell morphogenesis and NO signaling
MPYLDSSRTVSELLVEQPSRSKIFERYAIDYCCGGKRPLDEVCREKGIALDDVLEKLEQQDQMRDGSPETDWNAEKLTALADHIEQSHHAYLRDALPRLNRMIDKVAKVHGDVHPELKTVLEVFVGFRSELEMHMHKEEQVLFPMIRTLEGSQGVPRFHCGSIRNPINMMEAEHTDAGDAMGLFRDLTNNYDPPESACGTYRAMLAGLHELESDMHQHVHKENNILFPRAIALESSRAAG